MSWTLTIDCNELDGTTPARIAAGHTVDIQPRTPLRSGGSEVFGGKFTVGADGTLSVVMPDTTVDTSASGFTLTRYFGAQSVVLIPAQVAGSTHALTEFLDVTSLPLTPSQYALLDARINALGYDGGSL